MPVMFEDEGQEEMGDTEIHTLTVNILFYGLRAHFLLYAELLAYHVYSNLNLYYHPIKRWAYVSPDGMVARPERRPRIDVRSYRIGTTGPAPDFAAEVLSQRSFQQQDLSNKPRIYADLRVSEYVLIDPTGNYLPEKLLLKRLGPKQTWKDEQDSDGGVTSRFGFRLIMDSDGQLRVLDARTGRRYARPDEAEQAVRGQEEAVRAREEALRAQEEAVRAREEALRAQEEAEARVRELEAENARLRAAATRRNGKRNGT
jgi:hypothetical protein